MAIQFELAGSQIDGARDYQEDAFLITHLTDAKGNPSALVIVADGMGGHAAGNVASNMAVQAFNKHVSANYPTENPAEILQQCVLKANSSIAETVKETPALAGMGCTLVAAILEGNQLWWASVGDSHLYLLRNKELIKKNADHSYGGFLDRMAAAGTPVEPEEGLARNMLMSAITGDDINEIDVPSEPFELQPGDRVLICSDGMDTLSDGKIIQFSEWSESPKECAEALLQAVEDAGMPKQDNTTAVVVNIKEKEEIVLETPPAPEPVPEAKPEPEPAEAAAADLDRTHDENIPQQPAAAPPPPQPQQVVTEEKKSKAGMWIAIAAVVVIGVGVAVFMTMGGNKPAAVSPETEVAAVDSGSAEEQDQAAAAGGEAAATTTAAETASTEAAEKTAAAAPEKPETPAKPAANTGAYAAGTEFHDTLKDGSPAPAMVVIPAGKFSMGSPGTSRHADERPRHTVNINKFAISKYEVTFAEYDKFANATGRKLPDNQYQDRATYPVIFVTWDDAYYYADWLSDQTGFHYRLPSEAEWEYAAGAGERSPYWWGYDMKPNMAHCQLGCSSIYDPKKPTAVGSFKPNPFGVYDTAGNVAEWVQDCWHENYENAPTNGKEWVGGDCVYRAVRGGSYFSPEDSIRTQRRDKFKSDQAYDNIGIRLARDIK